MRDCDLSDSPLASCPPGVIQESLNDLLREELAPYIAPPDRREAFAGVDRVLAEHEEEFGSVAPAASGKNGIFEFIRGVYGDTRLPDEVRRRAASVGIASGDPTFNRPYQHYADAFGVTRACVHADSRDVQKDIGIRNRRDKSDAARATSRIRATGENRRKRARVNPRSLFGLIPNL